MSLTSELSELVELHRQGALTDAEFEIAKAKLLKSGDSNTKVRKRQDTPLQERVVRAESDPHPMRVVASAFVIASTIAAIVFATIVPYKYELSGGLAGDCSGPLFELFQRGDYNSAYDPNYVPPSNGGKYEDFFTDVKRSKYWDNFCIDEGKPRLIGSAVVLLASIGLLGFLWNNEIAVMIARRRRSSVNP